MINDPQNGYYGALVAGPPFREIADRVYANDNQMYDSIREQKVAASFKSKPVSKAGKKKATQQVLKAFGLPLIHASNSEYVTAADSNNNIQDSALRLTEGKVPDVMGMGLKDALYVVGNSGLKAHVKGSGKVVKQSLDAGGHVAKGAYILLELE